MPRRVWDAGSGHGASTHGRTMRTDVVRIRQASLRLWGEGKAVNAEVAEPAQGISDLRRFARQSFDPQIAR